MSNKIEEAPEAVIMCPLEESLKFHEGALT
jgi:hypothetical protein